MYRISYFIQLNEKPNFWETYSLSLRISVNLCPVSVCSFLVQWRYAHKSSKAISQRACLTVSRVSSSRVPSFSFTSLLLLLHRSSCNNSVNCTAVEDYKIEDLVSFAQSVLIVNCSSICIHIFFSLVSYDLVMWLISHFRKKYKNIHW